MTARELMNLFARSGRRTHLVGTEENGVVVALDMEGRLFTVVSGRVVSKVNPPAILARSNKREFQNPGGDALWPAPEGTCFGYEYSSKTWRVPPSIYGAEWNVVSQNVDACVVRSEIDLINNMQVGIPCEFERHIVLEKHGNGIRQQVRELIRYIGRRILDRTEFSLAPWSLCQLNASDTGVVRMPIPPTDEDVWDMYAPSNSQRGVREGLYEIRVKTPERFQVALSRNIPWLRYSDGAGCSVKRFAGVLPDGQRFIDIADAAPDEFPADKGVNMSVYCDPSGFVEIEACGGCPEWLEPESELYVDVVTEFELSENTL